MIDQSVECEGGLPSGSGTLKWVWDVGKKTAEGTGRIEAGEPNSPWVWRRSDGTLAEGPYVEGKKYGRWVVRGANGRTETVTFVNGEQQ